MAMEDDSLTSWLPTLLQTNDALFPTGAYAHSFGFEELVKMLRMRREEDLHAGVRGHIVPALAQQELPYLRFAYEAAQAGCAELCAVDREISAWKLARELREASVQIGGRRLAALRAGQDRPLYAELAAAIRAGVTPGHHLTVCAAQAVGEGIPLRAAMTAYYYQAVAGLCSAALKLIRIGQEGCQRVLRQALTQVEPTLATALAVPREDAGWFDPLLEIAAMRHEFAEERLFIS
jgi:urease accessory protein